VTSGAATHPAFLEKGGGGGCEETDFIRREELLCNVKCSPYGKREALAYASVDVINFIHRDNPPSPKAVA